MWEAWGRQTRVRALLPDQRDVAVPSPQHSAHAWGTCWCVAHACPRMHPRTECVKRLHIRPPEDRSCRANPGSSAQAATQQRLDDRDKPRPPPPQLQVNTMSAHRAPLTGHHLQNAREAAPLVVSRSPKVQRAGDVGCPAVVLPPGVQQQQRVAVHVAAAAGLRPVVDNGAVWPGTRCADRSTRVILWITCDGVRRLAAMSLLQHVRGANGQAAARAAANAGRGPAENVRRRLAS